MIPWHEQIYERCDTVTALLSERVCKRLFIPIICSRFIEQTCVFLFLTLQEMPTMMPCDPDVGRGRERR